MNTQNNTEQVREPVNKNIGKYYLTSRSYRQVWGTKRKYRTI